MGFHCNARDDIPVPTWVHLEPTVKLVSKSQLISKKKQLIFLKSSLVSTTYFFKRSFSFKKFV